MDGAILVVDAATGPIPRLANTFYLLAKLMYQTL